jgi:hypothetical protein
MQFGRQHAYNLVAAETTTTPKLGRNTQNNSGQSVPAIAVAITAVQFVCYMR